MKVLDILSYIFGAVCVAGGFLFMLFFMFAWTAL